MNKLRFASLGLIGRKKEMEVLRGCYDRFVLKLAKRQSFASEGAVPADSPKHNLARRGSNFVSSSANSNEVVFISGESGTGKVSWSRLESM
jgi:DNA-binding NtrC family response regulator